MALNEQEADLLLSTIEIIDKHAGLADVLDEIQGELVLLAPDHPEKVTQALEGWWLSVVAKRLVGEDNTQIPLQHLLKKAHEIGGWYGPATLPLSNPEDLGDKPYHPDDEAEVYVKQMRLLKLPEQTIHRGIRDFYRSHAQRSKWARESLLLDGESSRYDAKLQDHWERRFEAECADVAAEDGSAKLKAGRNVFFWASQQQVGFRNIVETWITAGSFHALSDRMKVGWHPDFVFHLSDKKK